MNKKFVVFNSEYASGARLIAKQLAEDLGIKFYGEKELLIIAYKEYEMYKDELINFEDELYKADVKNMDIYSREKLDQKINIISKIYEDVIFKLLNEGPCVLMERGCDVILQGREDVLNVYAYSSDLDKQKKRCLEVVGIPSYQAVEHIKKERIKREKYYELVYDTQRKEMREYAMCIDTDSFEVEKCAEIIKAAL